MKIAYLDVTAGISGDMFLGALLDLGLSVDTLIAELNKLNLDGYTLHVERVMKGPISATQLRFNCPDETQHRHLSSIQKLIDESALSPQVKAWSQEIFLKVAEAEAKIHNTTLEKLHFHEVGGMDSILDIVGACIALEHLEIKRLYASPIALGTGTTQTQHGTIPVPAPATLELLSGLPIHQKKIPAELTTPTGAAIVRARAEAFGPIPQMTLEAIGYGAGSRDLEIPNVLRILIGQTQTHDLATEPMEIIEANIDDLSPEIYEHLFHKLKEAGASDFFLTPIQMKKSRPAQKLTVLSPPDRIQALTQLIFEETSTIGMRWLNAQKVLLKRETQTLKTEWGDVRIKYAFLNGRVINKKPEYEDCKKIALDHQLPLKEVLERIHQKIA